MSGCRSCSCRQQYI